MTLPQNKGGIMEPIRCLLNTSSINNKTVNEYCLKSGKHITEIITDLGNNNQSIKEIYKDTLGCPEKIVDKVFGKLEIYYPGKSCVIKESNGEKTILPNNTMDIIVNNLFK